MSKLLGFLIFIVASGAFATNLPVVACQYGLDHSQWHLQNGYYGQKVLKPGEKLEVGAVTYTGQTGDGQIGVSIDLYFNGIHQGVQNILSKEKTIGLGDWENKVAFGVYIPNHDEASILLNSGTNSPLPHKLFMDICERILSENSVQ